jgi:hypothetical protein
MRVIGAKKVIDLDGGVGGKKIREHCKDFQEVW